MTWCDICKEHIYPDDEVECECVYPDCPMPALRAVNVGDELHQILGVALAHTNGER